MERLRIDKWLWAARFFKTRSLASRAADGGRVKLNGERAKPGKEIRVGDRLAVHVGDYTWEIVVVALSDRRGPAEVARGLYAEEEASRLRRQEQVREHRLTPDPAAERQGRPSRRDRRLIHRFSGEG